MSATKLTIVFDASDESELFYAFGARGESGTRRKIASVLRELDSQKGRTTPATYWYALPNTCAGDECCGCPTCTPDSDAYHTGFEAAKQGEPRNANPYASCTWGYDQWFAGWDDEMEG